ncbi:alpha/beta fold hydrolase [Salinisphaera sp. T31B1]|uniref:alpha/beta fold hydrolase n=1 Tax=Salinisphaera sp. T31B1 TaxID=727963 RepID=UPI0033426748
MSVPLAEARVQLGSHIDRARRQAEHARRHLFDRASLSQAGQTPFETVWSDGAMHLRYYPPLGEVTQPPRTPLVLVPPLAVNMLVYDLFPHRSLVRYLRTRGFELYLIDWGRPSRAQNARNLAGYFAQLLPQMLDRVRARTGCKRLNLHGWSLGGLFVLCQAALAADDEIANLVVVGAPVDYHDNGVLGERYRWLSRHAGRLHELTGLSAAQLPSAVLRSPGWVNSLAFKLTTPMASLRSYGRLLRNLHDDEYVRSHATHAAFLNGMVAYPGGVVADFIDYLWVDNVMADGRLPMADTQATLADVRAPILNITGQDDLIVTPRCSQAMADLVGAADITCKVEPGGHVSIVSGEQAARQSWPAIADWLIARD